jgi:hypothetical protein
VPGNKVAKKPAYIPQKLLATNAF